ncbi:MAG: DDE-type integrase/transposase/recombinase [Candidatus Diapherotrites archaeon]|nr:DDE-type integrase/transposase/recombinase [Candidatus Diapherotrites archaeon]
MQTKFQVINEYKQGRSAVELAERQGVSLRSFFRWLKRFDGSIESLRDGRAANGRERLKVTPEVEDHIVEFRAEKMGYKRIGWRLKRKHGVRLSPTAVKHWLKKHGLTGYKKKRKGKRRPDRTKKRFNQLWRLDIKDFRIKGVGKVHDYVGIDDCTRTLFAWAYKQKTAANAIEFVKRLIKKYGRPDEIRVDNGTQFVFLLKTKYKKHKLRKKTRRQTNKFGRFCKEQGIKLTFIPFARPNKNAKIERVIRTLKGELITRQQFNEIDDFNNKQIEYLTFYDNDREHGGLAGETPAEYRKQIKKQANKKSTNRATINSTFSCQH